MWKEPLNIHAPDGYAVVSTLLTQICYMAGMPGHPNIKLVDEITGRKPDEYGGGEVAFLLGQGFEVFRISSNNPEDFINGGLDYIKESHGTWNEQLAEHWTPERVATNQQAAQNELGIWRHYQQLDMFERINRPPTFGDIQTLIAYKYIVDVTIGQPGESIMGAALVYKFNGDRPWTYEPLVGTATTKNEWCPSMFMKHWLPKTICAYRRH